MFDSLDPRSHDSRERETHDPRDESLDPRDGFTRDLDLPRGLERERVHVHGHDEDYQLRGSEVRALATIGAFRVVPADELRDDHGRSGDVRHGDLEHLRRSGLIRTVAPLDRDGHRTSPRPHGSSDRHHAHLGCDDGRHLDGDGGVRLVTIRRRQESVPALLVSQ